MFGIGTLATYRTLAMVPINFEAIARLEAIATRLEAIAIGILTLLAIGRATFTRYHHYHTGDGLQV